MDSKANIVLLIAEEEDDDDCVILEGNPFTPTLINNNNLNEAGIDDLIVVRETGEVACRDYPHPRHLCATLPFASTSHFEHCRQCHCYVCDSLAPCPSWGTGTSVSDHCHATDKIGKWKIKRSSHRLHGGTHTPTTPIPQSPINKNETLKIQQNPRLYGGTNAPTATTIPQSPIIPRSVRLSNGAQSCNPQRSLPYQSYQYPEYTNPSYSYPSQDYTNPLCSLPNQNNGLQGGKNSSYNSCDNGSYYGSGDYINQSYNLLNGSQDYRMVGPPNYVYGSQGYANPTCGLPYPC